MWSGVDETPLDSSFVYPNDSADFTTGWNSGSGGWDQFDLAAGIEHPAGNPGRFCGSCPEYLDRPPTTNEPLCSEFQFRGVGVELTGIPATTVPHRQIGMEDH